MHTKLSNCVTHLKIFVHFLNILFHVVALPQPSREIEKNCFKFLSLNS
jgi:hypothetical protein